MSASRNASFEMGEHAREYCLDCIYKHATALQDHLSDAVAMGLDGEAPKRLELVREIRKWAMEKMRKNPETCVGCEGILAPGENPNPELAALERVCVWRKELVKPKEAFDPRSFRTLCPECPGARCAECPPELACASRLIIGCPLGQWDEVRGLCRVATEAHVIYHGAPKP